MVLSSETSVDGIEDPMATELYVDGKVIALKNEILGGASSAYDTLQELQTFLQNDSTAISGLLTAVGTKANQSDFNTLFGQQVILREDFEK